MDSHPLAEPVSSVSASTSSRPVRHFRPLVNSVHFLGNAFKRFRRIASRTHPATLSDGSSTLRSDTKPRPTAQRITKSRLQRLQLNNDVRDRQLPPGVSLLSCTESQNATSSEFPDDLWINVELLDIASSSGKQHAQSYQSCVSQLISNSSPVKRHFLRKLLQVPSQMLKALSHAVSPKGPGSNDTSTMERVLNVATCVPFFIAGWSFSRISTAGRFEPFGRALNLVGAVASIYHASSGAARPLLRKLDYWCIAFSSSLLRRLAVGQLPALAAAGVALLVPVKPTLVTTSNFVIVEVKCMLLALSSSSPTLMMSWLRHAVISAAATASFAFEDSLALAPLGPWVHAIWHCLAAAGMMTTGTVLEHAEGLHLQRAT